MIDIPVMGCITWAEYDIIKKANEIEEWEKVRGGAPALKIHIEREQAEMIARRTITDLPRC